jgi:60 kDa SS-A/Ro ribonucleoprotein
MMNYNDHYSTRKTSQTEKIPGSTQVENSAGGYSFPVDDWTRLDRFLILGTEGGSYYASEKALSKENAEAVHRCIALNGKRVIDTIVAISDSGRAPKNDPALYALAMCAGVGDEATRRAALAALPKVARIGTHLFHFAEYVKAFRGWGRGLRSAVANWYDEKDLDRLQRQVTKYRQRDGWSHRDLLRKSHPAAEANQRTYRWITQGASALDPALSKDDGLLWAFEQAQTTDDKKQLIKLIEAFNLPREVLPTRWLKDADVWGAMLPHMGLTAMIRNLGNMSKIGLVTSGSDAASLVIDRLGDEEALCKARVHPIQVLAALTVYQQGQSVRGSGTWSPVPRIVDALDDAFYLAFGNVEPTGKRTMIGLDVSGSMSWGDIAGVPGLTPAAASAAMCMVTARIEKEYEIRGFCHEFVDLGISPKQRLDDVMRRTASLSFGGTDCALPMVWALKNGYKADAFIVYTDSESWYSSIHPSQALQEYREKTGIPAKLIVVGMVSNGFTIADPEDGGMMDCCGFDTSTPSIMSNFIRDGYGQ